jgi:hypothetical protein
MEPRDDLGVVTTAFGPRWIFEGGPPDAVLKQFVYRSMHRDPQLISALPAGYLWVQIRKHVLFRLLHCCTVAEIASVAGLAKKTTTANKANDFRMVHFLWSRTRAVGAMRKQDCYGEAVPALQANSARQGGCASRKGAEDCRRFPKVSASANRSRDTVNTPFLQFSSLKKILLDAEIAR